MERNWKAVHWGSLLAILAFIVSLMAGQYMFTYGILIAAFVVGCMYLIAMSHFEDRPGNPNKPA